jgi:hypothetical protein
MKTISFAMGALTVVLACAMAVSARGDWPSTTFVAENRKQCPRIELARLTDGTLFAETDRAVSLLSPLRRRVVRDRIGKQCASETMGFYCENKVTIQSLDGWNLTPAFVARLCHRYRQCSEPAAC